MKKTIYYAATEGDIHGRYRKKGDSIGELTDREGKYLEMNGAITKTPPEAKAPEKRNEPDPATLERKTR